MSKSSSVQSQGLLFKIRTTEENVYVVAPNMRAALLSFESKPWDKKPIVLSAEAVDGKVFVAVPELL